MIPYGSKFTSTISGSKMKRVVCTHCGCDFLYEMNRFAQNTQESILWLNQDGAKRNAQAGAESQLVSKLESEFDIVPCPKCGNYQSNMVMDVLGKKKRNQNIIYLFFLFIAWIILTVYTQQSYPSTFCISTPVALMIAIYLLFRKVEISPELEVQQRVCKPYFHNNFVQLTSEYIARKIAQESSRSQARVRETGENIPRTKEEEKVITPSAHPIEGDNETKTCPYCAEKIKKAAIVCRYCKRDLPK